MDEGEAIGRVREHLERQFPRSCPGCGRSFATLRDYLLCTQHVGDPVSEALEAGVADAEDPGAVMSMASCPCGTTMAITSEGLAPLTQLALLRYARHEARRRGISFAAFLREFRARIDRQVLSEPARPPSPSNLPPADRAAHLYERTLVQVTDDLRMVVALLVALACAWLVTRTSGAGGPVVASLLAALGLALWALPHRPRLAAGIALLMLEVLLVASLIAFGPLAGTGALAAIGVLLAAIRYGRKTSIGVALLAMVTIGVVGVLAVRHGWGGHVALPIRVWVRTGTVCGAISLFIALATSSLLSGLRKALAEVESVRRAGEEAQAELARRRELETAGRLISGVAHDVNNSLTVMACCADELRNESLSPAALELLNDMETTTQAASATMRAVLDLVRPEKGEIPQCDPARVIAAGARNLKRLLPDDVTLTTSLIEGHTVALPAGALMQATLNLILNARDALVDEIRTIAVAVEPSDHSVVVSVRDTGRGMDAATRARVGEAFFSTKGKTGTGLGLNMVRATVEGCGGRVVIDSEPGRGTEVRLVLPTVAPLAESVGTRASSDMVGARVLLVEDDGAIRRAFARGLSALGATVTERPTVTQALAALGVGDASFDILVCDGILGDGSVADVVLPFRLRWPGAAVVICTAHDREVLAARGVTLEGATVLAKPVSGAQLARACARALRESGSRLEPGDRREPA